MTNYERRDIILHAQDISVIYGNKTIIRNVNFEEKDTTVPGKVQGQVIAFLGRSGRGKSSLFRVLTGLEKPTSGRVMIPDYSRNSTNGQQPAKVVEEGDVGFVDQKYTLFRHKTLYQSLLFALRKSMYAPGEKHDKIMQYLSDWGLEKVKDQYPNEMSGGQRQRTAILEQLLSSGYYMVLDEPFSGLDVGNIENVKNAFALINRSHELNTIIFSTHDIELAVELADSIYILGHNCDADTDGAGTIIRHYDLKALGLAWHTSFTPQHSELLQEIKSALLAS